MDNYLCWHQLYMSCDDYSCRAKNFKSTKPFVMYVYGFGMNSAPSYMA